MKGRTIMAQITISYAGYGNGNQINDVTDVVRGYYNNGERTFECDDDKYGDPKPGYTKSLFIVWQHGSQTGMGVAPDRGVIIRVP
jgi:hypothetical protein